MERINTLLVLSASMAPAARKAIEKWTGRADRFTLGLYGINAVSGSAITHYADSFDLTWIERIRLNTAIGDRDIYVYDYSRGDFAPTRKVLTALSLKKIQK